MSPKLRSSPPVKKAKSRDVELHNAPPWLVLVLLLPRIMVAAVITALAAWFLWTQEGSANPNGKLLPMRHGSVTMTGADADS